MSTTRQRTAPPARRIFCNRTLNLRSIRAVGFDMDYTLVHYQVEEWERACFDHVKQSLLDRGKLENWADKKHDVCTHVTATGQQELAQIPHQAEKCISAGSTVTLPRKNANASVAEVMKMDTPADLQQRPQRSGIVSFRVFFQRNSCILSATVSSSRCIVTAPGILG